MVVADVIFHWDINDSYIQPTSEDSWVKDLQQVLKSYPKTTKKTVYTNWKNDKTAELDATFEPLNNLPLDTNMWLNKPTIQERFGWPALAAGVAVAAGIYFMIDQQKRELGDLQRKTTMERQQSGFGDNFRQIVNQVQEQEQFMRFRYLYSLILKDVAMALANSNFEIGDFKVENPTPNIPSDVALVTITSKPRAYRGYLEQEPIAKELLKQSVTMLEIRKPPIDRDTLTLEGLVYLTDLDERVRRQTREAQLISGAARPLATTPAAPQPDAPQDDADGQNEE
jgi:hypothetical protein